MSQTLLAEGASRGKSDGFLGAADEGRRAAQTGVGRKEIAIIEQQGSIPIEVLRSRKAAAESGLKQQVCGDEDLAEWAVNEVVTRALSKPGTDAERELLAIEEVLEELRSADRPPPP